MPLFRRVRTLFSKTKKAKPKSTSKSISRSFSPNTKKKIASFTRKRDIKRGFRTIKRLQEDKMYAPPDGWQLPPGWQLPVTPREESGQAPGPSFASAWAAAARRREEEIDRAYDLLTLHLQRMR